MSHWDDRIKGAVLNAIRDGHTIFTGLGPLEPGDPIGMPQSEAKPAGIPNWVTYLTSKGNNPDLRWIRLSQKVRNPMGPATQLYPMPSAKKDLAMPLIVPLGEGFDSIPPDEADLIKDLLAHVLYKVVRTIGFGRIRYSHGGSSAPFPEPILLEVYSEAGELIWKNPRLTLEQCIANAQGLPLERVVPSVAISTAVQVPSIPRIAPTVGPTAAARMDLGQMFEDLEAQGLNPDQIVETVSRSASVPLGIVSTVYAKHQRNKGRLAPNAAWDAAIASARQFDLEGEDLIEAVAGTVGATTDQIAQYLVNGRLAASPSGTPVSSKAPKRTAALTSTGDVATALGAQTHVDVLKGGPGKTKIAGTATSTREQALKISATIAARAEEYRSEVLKALAAASGPLDAGTLRHTLGLPMGGSGDMKLVADSFFRNVLKHLLKSPAKIVASGSRRGTSYTLAGNP